MRSDTEGKSKRGGCWLRWGCDVGTIAPSGTWWSTLEPELVLDSHELILDMVNCTFLEVKSGKEDCLDHGVDSATIAPIPRRAEVQIQTGLRLHR
jgi:hypothetical protein